MTDASSDETTPRWYRALSPAGIVASLLALSYVGAVAYHRFEPAFKAWSAEGDAKQVIWQFYSLFDPGVLPKGNLLVDYTWAYNAPPIYRLIMMPLSMVMDPIIAGHVVSVVLWVAALAAIYYLGRRLVHHYAGLTAVIVFAQSPWWHKMMAGGYGRSFGPTLTLLFLAAWLSGRRRLALATMVVMAGTHPSPMMACGLAFGLWTLWQFYLDRKWRPVVELAAAGVVMILLGLSQNIMAAEWWGSPVWYSDVLEHGAFQRGSRMEFVPHPPLFGKAFLYFSGLFHYTGEVWFPSLTSWNKKHDFLLNFAPLAVLALLGLVKKIPFPKRVILLFVCAFLAYVLAYLLAFKLHVPTRPMTHVWPAIMALSIALLSFMSVKAWLPRRPILAAVLGGLLALGPMFAFRADGLGTWHIYGDYSGDAKLFTYIQERTPKDAVFAGNYRGMDLVGLFGRRVPYVNWILAHPFRPGFWAEIERRTLRMYEAYWAVDVDTVLEFAAEEGVSYLLVDVRNFKRFVEQRTIVKPFPPLVKPVRRYYDECRKKRCVLNEVPAEAVVYKHRHWRLIDVEKLKQVADRIPPYQDD